MSLQLLVRETRAHRLESLVIAVLVPTCFDADIGFQDILLEASIFAWCDDTLHRIYGYDIPYETWFFFSRHKSSFIRS